MNAHPQRGEIGGGVLGAVVVVIVIGAIAQLLGFDAVGLLSDAIHWTADKLGDLCSSVFGTAQGRN